MWRDALVVLALAWTAQACGDRASGPADVLPDTETSDDATDTSEVADDTFDDVALLDTASDVIDTSLDVGPLDRTLIPVDVALAYVDPFIGTGGLGYGYAALSPAAQVPFGMVKVGPDSTQGGLHVAQNHFSGYYAGDPHLRGFSHTRLVGAAVQGYGQLRVLPVAERDERLPSDRYVTYRDEVARPGYYGVRLDDEGVDVAIAATAHGAVHRYTFGASGGTVLVDMSASMDDAGAVWTHFDCDAHGFEGAFTFAGHFVTRSRPFTFYAVGEWSEPAERVETWTDAGYSASSVVDALHGGGAFTFGADRAVELRVGVSYVDLAQARANLEVELGDRTFESIDAAATDAWRARFEAVRVGLVPEDVATIFFTALYNAYRLPTRFDGVDGRYRGFDGEVHTADFGYYTDLSLWDTYRTLHPWLTLVAPDVQRDTVRSMIAMGEQGGYVPRWAAAMSYAGAMLGDPAAQVIAGSALKGITGVDYDLAFELLMRSATALVPEAHPYAGRAHVDEYLAYGYVTSAHDQSVALTLEFAWSDHALSQLAALLGRDEADALAARGRAFEHVFDSGVGFFAPRQADGSFDALDLRAYTDNRGPYVQGTAWQWRYYGIHEAERLVALYDSDDAFHQGLSTFFSRSDYGSREAISHLLPPTYYWHGNEPDLHAAYLFHEVDAYGELSYWVRQIQTRAYGVGPDGLAGNDDGGTLSAWYLFNALGLFPVAGTDRYYLSTPMVPYAEVTLADGSVLTIEAQGAPSRYTVASVSLNGDPILDGVVHHDALSGATLRFDFADQEWLP